MNQLVVGVDGSEPSRLALQWAASIAKALARQLLVVEADALGDQRDLAEAARETSGDSLVDVEAEFEILQGSPAGAILQRVTADDGLVLGSRGRGGFAGLLLGSVSRECAEHAPCPVMIVRQQLPAPNDQTPILVGHDGSPSSKRALEWAIGVSQATGAEVIAAYVWQAAASEVRPRLHRRLVADAGHSIAQWAAEVSPAVRPVEIEGEPRMALVDLAQRAGAALLVVGRRGKGTVRALRIGSVAAYLMTSSPAPIAIIPPSPDTELS
jgi:nucleotide-binding universal stress UspA family protein